MLAWRRFRWADADQAQSVLPLGEVALAHDQATVEPENLTQARVELNPGGAGPQPDLAEEGDHVAVIDDLKWRVVTDLPCLAQVGGPLPQALMASIDAR